MSVDLAEVRKLYESCRPNQTVDAYSAMKLAKMVPQMVDEIEAYRDLLDRVEIEMQDRQYHNEDCGCRWCELYREVCRVNQEMPDAT